MHHTKLFATLAVAATFALAACGGTSAPEPEAAVPTAAQVAQAPTDAPAPTSMPEPTDAPAPTDAPEPTAQAPAADAAAVPDGWTAYSPSDASFSLALPASWNELAMDDTLLDASLDAVKDQNPEIAELMSGQARALMQSGVKFFAFDDNDDAVQRGFATNINVISQDIPVSEVSLDQIKDASLDQLKALPGLVDPVATNVTLANGVEALQVVYGFDITTQTGQATKTSTMQYLVLENGTLFVVTFSTTDDQASDYEATFSQIAQTFTFE